MRNETDYWSLYIPLKNVYLVHRAWPSEFYHNVNANKKRIEQAERRWQRRAGYVT